MPDHKGLEGKFPITQSKTKDLKPGRREHISEEEVEKYLDKILNNE